jgi:HSP20 family molecular chaperone IbpA
MSFARALAPLRRAHFLRPRSHDPFTSLFERDPFFAGIAPIFNNELASFQRYNFPRVDIKESPKAYRLEAEVPGFRKSDLSIEFTDPRTLRIAGKRQVSQSSALDDETTGAQTADEVSNTVDAKTPESTKSVESNTSDQAITEAESKEVEAVESEEDYQVVETDRDQEVTFSRQWRLPEPVDQDAVKASLDHGILSVVVPKLKAEASRKVVID